MNKDIFAGKWKQAEGSAQKTWGKITGDSWTEIKGNRDTLLGKIQESYGKSKDEAELEISRWEKENKFDDTETDEITVTSRKA